MARSSSPSRPPLSRYVFSAPRRQAGTRAQYLACMGMGEPPTCAGGCLGRSSSSIVKALHSTGSQSLGEKRGQLSTGSRHCGRLREEAEVNANMK